MLFKNMFVLWSMQENKVDSWENILQKKTENPKSNKANRNQNTFDKKKKKFNGYLFWLSKITEMIVFSLSRSLDVRSYIAIKIRQRV